MAEIGGSNLSLIDIAKKQTDGGKFIKIVEMMKQKNGIVDDAVWKEGNLSTGEMFGQTVSLPTVSFRKANEGTTPSDGNEQQIVAAAAMMESWSVTDSFVAELGGNPEKVRMDKSRKHFIAMHNTLATKFFYGNTSTTPEEPNGLSIYYASSTGTTGENVIKAGGSGADNASIWFVHWSEDTIYAFYPKGSVAGFRHTPYPKAPHAMSDAGGASKLMEAYRDKYEWKCGLAVANWMSAVRICNIDISALIAGSGADLLDKMIAADHRLETAGGRTAIYMNRTVAAQLDIQARNDVTTGGQLSYEVFDGKRVTMFRKAPIRICDALTNAETLVS